MRVRLMEPYGHGGINYYAYSLAESLAAHGAEVELITTHDSESLSSSRGVSLIAELEGFHTVPDITWPLRKARSAVLHARNFAMIRRDMASSGVDVAHFVFEPIMWADRCVPAVGRRRPVVHTVHNILPHDSDRAAVIPRWSRVYQACDALVCHNQATLDDLRFTFGEEIASRAVIIPHPIDNADWPDPASLDAGAARRELDLPNDAFIILAFGAIRPYKGLTSLIEVMPHVLSALPEARLVVAGGCADWDPYRQMIDRLGIGHAVIERIGWIDRRDIAGYFAAADVAPLPYRSIDGSGVAAVAAFMGTPMVLSDLPGFRAAWREDEVLYSDVTAESLAEALLSVHRCPAVACGRAQKLRERATSEMSWSSSAQAHLEVYRKAIERFGSR